MISPYAMIRAHADTNFQHQRNTYRAIPSGHQAHLNSVRLIHLLCHIIPMVRSVPAGNRWAILLRTEPFYNNGTPQTCHPSHTKQPHQNVSWDILVSASSIRAWTWHSSYWCHYIPCNNVHQTRNSVRDKKESSSLAQPQMSHVGSRTSHASIHHALLHQAWPATGRTNRLWYNHAPTYHSTLVQGNVPFQWTKHSMVITPWLAYASNILGHYTMVQAVRTYHT